MKLLKYSIFERKRKKERRIWRLIISVVVRESETQKERERDRERAREIR